MLKLPAGRPATTRLAARQVRRHHRILVIRNSRARRTVTERSLAPSCPHWPRRTWEHFAAVVHEHIADDIRVGWDNHLQFARENPNFYKLMWSPAIAPNSAALREAYQMLYERLKLGAARGQLRMSAETAARTVMSATIGAALSLISQPDLFGDGTFATHLREAVIASIAVPQDAAPAPKRCTPAAEPALATSAAMLSSKLTAENTPLTDPERALMQQWLTTLADACAPTPPGPPRRPPQTTLGGSR
jgi:hypothetical protein